MKYNDFDWEKIVHFNWERPCTEYEKRQLTNKQTKNCFKFLVKGST